MHSAGRNVGADGAVEVDDGHEDRASRDSVELVHRLVPVWLHTQSNVAHNWVVQYFLL